jgi:protein involved in polysaccharide export with SLBB domain
MKTIIAILLTLLCMAQAATAQEDSYRLGPGDRIDIRVFGEEDLSMSVLIGDSGVLNYPLLGEVQVAGRTVKEVEIGLTERLLGDYLIDPDVTVSVDEYRPVFINGEVKKPGAYPFQPGLTLQKAIALAGGFTERASRGNIKVLAADGVERDSVKLNAVIQPGAVITVEQSFF